MMYYVYVLKMSNNQLYIGFTNDIRKRIKEHKEAKVFTTRKFLPIKLIYYECYLSHQDAKERESMIKKFGSSYSHLKHRIRNSIKGLQERGHDQLND